MDSFFNKMISENDFVLIDFYAVWCEPCKWALPVLDKVSKHFGDRIHFEKIDIDQHIEISRSFHILSVPTFVLFHKSHEVWRMRGFDAPEKMIKQIGEYLER